MTRFEVVGDEPDEIFSRLRVLPTFICASSSSCRSYRPLEPRVQRHQILDDNFLFTVRESLYAHTCFVGIIVLVCMYLYSYEDSIPTES